MVQLLLVAVTVCVFGLFLLADHVKNRFRHTRTSRRILGVEAILTTLGTCTAVVMGWKAAWPLRLGVGLLLSGPVFILTAFITVETWRRRKQVTFDRQIARLIRERNRLQEQLERLTWEFNDLERRRARSAGAVQDLESRVRALRDQVEAWVHGTAGYDPVRAVNVQRWRQDWEGLTTDQLTRLQSQLHAEAARAAGAEAAQWTGRLLVLQLILAERQVIEARSGAAPGDVATRLRQCERARSQAEDRLARIMEELRAWQERKTLFLREKIPLD